MQKTIKLNEVANSRNTASSVLCGYVGEDPVFQHLHKVEANKNILIKSWKEPQTHYSRTIFRT